MRTNEQIQNVYSQLYKAYEPHIRNPQDKILEITLKILYGKLEEEAKLRLEDLELDELKQVMLFCQKGEKAVVGEKESTGKSAKKRRQKEIAGSILRSPEL